MPQHRQPGLPRTPKPPPRLKTLVDEFVRTGVASVGLTTTNDGEWALLVRVPPDDAIPIPEIEARAAGLPVVYEQIEALPVARPAFPARGE